MCCSVQSVTALAIGKRVAATWQCDAACASGVVAAAAAAAQVVPKLIRHLWFTLSQGTTSSCMMAVARFGMQWKACCMRTAPSGTPACWLCSSVSLFFMMCLRGPQPCGAACAPACMCASKMAETHMHVCRLACPTHDAAASSAVMLVPCASARRSPGQQPHGTSAAWRESVFRHHTPQLPAAASP